jgi:phosphoribosylglycinamide formyltransferase-1
LGRRASARTGKYIDQRRKQVTDLNFGILVSGNGSVLKTVLRACRDGEVPGRVLAVASNQECPALEVARQAQVPHVRSYPIDDYDSRVKRDAAMAADLVVAGVDFVIVGGYSEVLEDGFLRSFKDRAISMYPALLPAFGELDEAIGPALEYGVKSVGVTIHFREPLSLSAGPIIAQEPLPVDVHDTVATVTSRVIDLESRFLPRVLRWFADGRVARQGNRVRVEAAP